MFHNLGPLEGGRSIVLVRWREGIPLSWSTGGRAFHNLGPLEGGCSIIMVHWKERIP